MLNKMDLLPEEEREQRCQDFIKAIGWSGPVYYISAVNGEGCRVLTGALMNRLEELKEAAINNVEPENVESSQDSES